MKSTRKSQLMNRVMIIPIVKGKCYMCAYLLATIFIFSNSATAFFKNSVPGQIYFSPDSSKIAFLWFEQWFIPFGNNDIYKRYVHVYWCNTTDTENHKSVKVDTIGKEYAGYVSIPTDLTFSPDSRHLVIFTPNHLSLIDLDTKKLSRLCKSEESVTSFQWLGNEMLGYATFSPSEDKSSLTFWKQNINDNQDNRERIYCEEVEKEYVPLETPQIAFPMEYWSSKGKYVLFFTNFFTVNSKLKLLNVDKRSVLAFGRPRSYIEIFLGRSVSWKPDESSVFCVGGIVAKGDTNWAYLVETETGNIIDCSKEIISTFKTKYSLSLEPSWTVDGKYILANQHLGLGGCLIEPHSWKVIAAKQHLIEKLGVDKATSHIIFNLPIPNWVGVNAAGLQKNYAIDYNMENITPLFDCTQGSWAFSPNGRYAAVIGYKKKLVLHSSHLQKELEK